MATGWIASLHMDPLPELLATDDMSLAYFVRRDLLLQKVPPIETLWQSGEALQQVHRQQQDGSWRYPGNCNNAADTNHQLLETYRAVRLLVDKYEMDRAQQPVRLAAEYFFSCQTPEGDIRGILGNQYMPYYHGAILGLLVSAGFGADERVRVGLSWLLDMRQHDGGWIVPAQGVPASSKTRSFWPSEPLPPNRTLPNSHLATGMALRAFAAHPEYRSISEVLAAARCLKCRLFQPDRYYDRKAPSYWLKFQFPFWWTSLVTTMDTLWWLGFDRSDEHVAAGLRWFVDYQSEDGLWDTGYGAGKKAENHRAWVGLAICRILRRYFGEAQNGFSSSNA